MLLGAARYLAETRNFNGTVNFIFQPAEEGIGGALAMLEDGLFQRFPCKRSSACTTAGHAGRQVRHRAGHRDGGGGVLRHHCHGQGRARCAAGGSIDPVWLPATSARRCNRSCRATVAARDGGGQRDRILSGDAYNVIPQTAGVGGTVRVMKRER